jgi:imidazole glycerol-phosphate synthase subunit HisH
MSIGILDYGMANLRSVQNGFAAAGHAARIISTADEVRHVDRLVLPGVGAFADAIATLRQHGLDQAIIRFIDSGKPFLGICLGLQMLFDVGYEDGEHTGLGILRGQCERFTVDTQVPALKVPHMGWNQLDFRTPSPLLRGLNDGCHVYFVHGYHAVATDTNIIATTTEYGPAFVSSIWRDNIVATQFHPEKSQKIGLTMLNNFAEM